METRQDAWSIRGRITLMSFISSKWRSYMFILDMSISLTCRPSQPIGVGFSEIADRDDIAVSLEQGARDIYSFLSILSTEVFPEFSGRPWHITGESMGGHYVTGYTKYIMELEHERVARGLDPHINISSAVIVDGYIDSSYQSSGYYDFFCTDWDPVSQLRTAPLMNQTACAEMAAVVPTCELMGAHCRESYNSKVCLSMMDTCERTVGKYYTRDIRPGGWDPYDSESQLIQYSVLEYRLEVLIQIADVSQVVTPARSLRCAPTLLMGKHGDSLTNLGYKKCLDSRDYPLS